VTLFLLVAARIVSNPVVNVFQKQLTARSAHPVWVIAITHALLTLACLPWALSAVPLRPGFWENIWLCAALAVTSNVLLVYALRVGDLSVLGPINSYKPVVSLAVGVFVLHELPTPSGLAGMLLILAGSYLVVDHGSHGARGVPLRLAALVFSATEAVFLKKALLLSSPGTVFVFWSVLGLPLAGIATGIIVRSGLGQQLSLLRSEWPTFLWLAVTTGIMQCSTLFTFGRLPVGYSLALFQLSTLVSVFLGHRYFREPEIRRRVAGAAVMTAGAILIVLA
jgi:drug/metabolite transporter (DMT)-like permease